VGGLCVGRGYRNAPELTQASFTDSPFEIGDRLYSTGDIACWTAAGEILLAGRVTDR
jgi:surfactin family lipopeptide synthetase A